VVSFAFRLPVTWGQRQPVLVEQEAGWTPPGVQPRFLCCDVDIKCDVPRQMGGQCSVETLRLPTAVLKFTLLHVTVVYVRVEHSED
jgi:hypothetical protein